MSTSAHSSHFNFADRQVRRMGYGAMQLAGPHVFGPPKDRAACIAVLREAIAAGVDHIDTSDFYGPHVTNQIIHEALHPYSDELTLVTKIGAGATTRATGWPPIVRKSCAAPSRTICAISAWHPWTWSTCASSAMA